MGVLGESLGAKPRSKSVKEKKRERLLQVNGYVIQLQSPSPSPVVNRGYFAECVMLGPTKLPEVDEPRHTLVPHIG